MLRYDYNQNTLTLDVVNELRCGVITFYTEASQCLWLWQHWLSPAIVTCRIHQFNAITFFFFIIMLILSVSLTGDATGDVINLSSEWSIMSNVNLKRFFFFNYLAVKNKGLTILNGTNQTKPNWGMWLSVFAQWTISLTTLCPLCRYQSCSSGPTPASPPVLPWRECSP